MSRQRREAVELMLLLVAVNVAVFLLCKWKVI